MLQTNPKNQVEEVGKLIILIIQKEKVESKLKFFLIVQKKTSIFK